MIFYVILVYLGIGVVSTVAMIVAMYNICKKDKLFNDRFESDAERAKEMSSSETGWVDGIIKSIILWPIVLPSNILYFIQNTLSDD